MPVTPPRVDPVTRPLSILESARAARRNLLGIIPAIAFRQPILSGRTVARWHMVQDPDGLRRVLKDRVEAYPKSDTTVRMLRPAIGDSLFTAEGAHWRWQRRAASPVFAHRNLVKLAPFMTRSAERTVRRLEATGDEADLNREMVAATFDVISDVAMSGKDVFDREAVARSVTGYIQTIGRISLLDVLAVPNWVPRPAQLFHGRVNDEVARMMDRVIAERAAEPRREDLMSMMLEAEDPETGRRMTPEELRDNMLAFLVAGHETTALALSWALYLIALDRGVQDRLAEEARAAIGGPGAAGAEHLDRLGYHEQVILEAMRLYPPAGMISRTAREADTLLGREVRRGDTVIVPIYALHRHQMWWENPDAFDPEKFAPDKVAARDRYTYLPFGAGPRICIGMNFVLYEARIILATLVNRFRFAPVAGRVPQPVMLMTLRPQGGVPLKIAPRD